MDMYMPNIHLQNNTKSRLNTAVAIYAEEKHLPEDLTERISYDFIINEVLDKIGVPK